MIIGRKDRTNELFCYMLVFSILVETMNGLIRTVVTNTYKIDTAFFYAVYFILIFTSLKYVIRRISTKHVAFLIVFFVVWVFALLVSKSTDVNCDVGVTIITKCVPAYLVAISVVDYTDLQKKLYYSACVIIGMATIQLILGFTYQMTNQHSQSAGYQLLPAAVIFLHTFTRGGKVRDLILSLVAAGLMLASGARGPIIGYIISAFVIVIFEKELKRSSKVILFCCTVAIIIAINGSTSSIISISDFLKNSGYSTRVIDLLTSKSLIVDRERNMLFTASMKLIEEHFVLGTGVINDRFELSKLVYIGSASGVIGTYPHNIIIEVLIQFGCFVGTALIGWFIYVTKKALREINQRRSLVVLLLAMALPSLLYSGSYIQEPLFYMLLGVLMTQKRNTGALCDEN